MCAICIVHAFVVKLVFFRESFNQTHGKHRQLVMAQALQVVAQALENYED